MIPGAELRSPQDEPHERHTVRELLERAASRLSDPALRSEDPSMESRELLAFALGVEPGQLPSLQGERPQREQIDRFIGLLARRLGDEPTGYIVGGVELRGVRFKVDRRAFIARQDLPVVVDAALEGVPHDVQGFALDLACGMGAAGILLGVARPGLSVDLADVSAEAVQLARENAERILPGRARAFVSDLFDGAPLERRGRYRVIVANPPWVPDGTPLPSEVIDHEPTVSFFGGPDGLDLVRRIISALPQWLKPDGRYAQECDPSQVAKVIALLEQAGLRGSRAHRDAEGVERVVSARLP